MSFIARWCFRHRFAVIAAWVLALIALTALAQAVKAEYNNSFSLAGTGSTTAQQLLASTVPAQSGDSDTIVWHVGTGTVRDQAVMTRMTATLNRIATFPKVASVLSPYRPGGSAQGGSGQISRDGRTAYAVVTFTQQSDVLANADVVRVINAAQAAREPGLDVQLGGQAIGNIEQAQVPLSLSTVVGVIAAAIVLFIAFGSLLAALLPLITALAGVVGGLMAIAPLTHTMPVMFSRRSSRRSSGLASGSTTRCSSSAGTGAAWKRGSRRRRRRSRRSTPPGAPSCSPAAQCASRCSASWCSTSASSTGWRSPARSP